MKIDQGFLMAVLAMFSSGEASDEDEIPEFHKDCKAVDQSLMEDTIQSVISEVRHFYDLSCEPIKVTYCVSLSLLVRDCKITFQVALF